MESLGDLSAEHQEQVRQFLRFFRSKREVALQALSADFEDIKSDRLMEDMYSQDDVVELLDSLFGIAQGTFKSELANSANMTVLLLKQLFEKADEQGTHLEMDMGVVEDQGVLDDIENMRLDVTAPKKQQTSNKLTSLKDDHAKLVSEQGALGKAHEELQDRFHSLQQQTSEVLREKSALAREVSELRGRLRMLEADRVATEADLKAEAEAKGAVGPALQRELDELKAELGEAKEENQKKLNESKQYAQMRKIINTKSEQIKQLRARLARYESDDVDCAEDSDDGAK